MSNTIRIVPYVDKSRFNLGLEAQNKLMLDSVKHTFVVRCVNEAGGIRYVTGLNPYAKDILRLEKKEREAKQSQIKQELIEYEARVGGQVISDKDPQWSNKIVYLRADNKDFWESDQMKLSLGNYPVVLNKDDIYGQLKLKAIYAGAYPEVATSLEALKQSNGQCRWYLDIQEETLAETTSYKKLRNKAGAILQDLYEKNPNKLLYVTKLIVPNNTQFKARTPIDLLYEACDKFISGEWVQNDKSKTAAQFIEIAGKEMSELKNECIVKDALSYRLIHMKSDGLFYHMETMTAMGKNVQEVVAFIASPINDDIYQKLLIEVEKLWAL